MRSAPLVGLVAALVACAAAAQYPTSCPVSPPLLPVDAASDPAVKSALAKIDAMLQNSTRPATAIPGLVAIIVQGENVIFSRGYGSANFTDPKAAAPDESTVTRIASITKTVTGLQLAHLRDAGVVGMDDPVAKYTPGFSVKTPYNTTRPITLRELASHTSGLERENPCGQTCNETEVLAAIARHYVVAPQHHRPHYSNLGYSLLGRTLGHAAGVSYEEYVTDKMLKPLGCPEATFAFNEYVKSHIAVGVDNAGDTVPVGGDSWNEGWDAPCGGLYASAADMAEYMKLMLRRDVPAGGLGGAQILDSATVEEVLKPAILLRDGEAAFGFPWEFQYVGADQHGHWARSKAGELSGYRSQVALIPELGLGMFASAFRSDVTPFDASDTVWTLPALSQLIEPVTALLAAAQPAPTLPADAGVYIGTYGPQDSRMVISADGQQLVGDFAGQAVLLSVFDGAGDGEHVLRAKLAKPGDTACRWLDDGSNLELVYFDVPQPGKPAASFDFMGGTYGRVSDA